MMKKVFLDSDIIIDLISQRLPFYNDAAQIFTLLDLNKFMGFTTPVVFSNLFYILSKLKNKSFAIKNLNKLRSILNILTVDEKTIDLSLASDFTDFEDAIQYYSSIENGINIIITRNKKDYKNCKIPVLSPKEFLSNI